MTTNDYILAFDFGGTKLTAALFAAAALEAANPAWVAHHRVLSPEAADAAQDQEMMITLGWELLGERRPAALGVSFGGPVDYAAGVVRLSHHVPGWEEVPLQARLEAEFGCPVRVDNDANVAALGEWRFGAGRGQESLFYVTVSTGVGGGWVLDGRPWRGHGGMAGEVGHTVVDPQGPRCLCGKQGCVERLASGPYMADDLASAWEAAGREVTKPVTGKTVAAAAAAGDEAARRVLRRGARALGTGLGNVANLINPERFVVGGGVTKSGDAWWQMVRWAARKTALPEVEFDVAPAALGDESPLWGALALAAPLVAGEEQVGM